MARRFGGAARIGWAVYTWSAVCSKFANVATAANALPQGTFSFFCGVENRRGNFRSPNHLLVVDRMHHYEPLIQRIQLAYLDVT